MINLLFRTVRITSSELIDLCDELLSLITAKSPLDKLLGNKLNDCLRILTDDLANDKNPITSTYLKSVAMFAKYLKEISTNNSHVTIFQTLCLKMLIKIEKREAIKMSCV